VSIAARDRTWPTFPDKTKQKIIEQIIDEIKIIEIIFRLGCIADLI
jgi:hypothetical protein